MIHRIERGLGPRGHNRYRHQRHKHVFHVKQPLHTSLLHHSHHRQQKLRHAPPAQPPKSRFEPVTTLALFHVKHSAPVPTGARTRKRATTHQPRTQPQIPTSGVPPLGSTPLNHSRTPTPRAFPQSRTRAETYRGKAPRQPIPRRPASPPPLAQPPREDPMPRREDPCEYEARGEHQDDCGARGHVQGPREVQADEAPRSTQHG